MLMAGSCQPRGTGWNFVRLRGCGEEVEIFEIVTHTHTHTAAPPRLPLIPVETVTGITWPAQGETGLERRSWAGDCPHGEKMPVSVTVKDLCLRSGCEDLETTARASTAGLLTAV